MMNENPFPTSGPSTEDLREEERKLRHLRCMTDATAFVIAQGEVTVLEACSLMRLARRYALKLFPDKAEVFDLIYRPRFARIVSERLSNSPTWMN
jgi:hypothetical protein